MVPNWVLNSPKACGECYLRSLGGKKIKITDLTSSSSFHSWNLMKKYKKNKSLLLGTISEGLFNLHALMGFE
jgi:hypothetical protein